jgi:hypothetical protein
MDLNRFKTDENAELHGVWVPLGEGLEVLVARAGNENFNRLFRALAKPYQRQMEAGTFPEDQAKELLCDAYSKTILLDWRGLEEDGTPLAYSQAECKRVLLGSRDFRDIIVAISKEAEVYREALIEEDAETLGNGSGGRSAGDHGSRNSEDETAVD